MDSYLSAQKSTIFAHVGVLIYVFDTQETDKEWENDLGYFRQCLAALAKFSPECVTFVLVHKMVRRFFFPSSKPISLYSRISCPLQTGQHI